MQILLIADCYLPSKKSSAKLVSDLASKMVDMGHDVVVAVPDDTVRRKFEISDQNGVTVLHIKCGKIKDVNRVIRAFNEVRLSSTFWNHAKSFFKSNRFDYIVFYSPSIFFGRLVVRLKQLWQCDSYLILRDIFPQWAVDAGVLKDGLICKYFRKREMEQYKAADVIGVEASGCIPYLRKKLGAGKEIEVLYNWTSILSQLRKSAEHRTRLKLNNKFVFFYGGNIGVAQELDNIIDLAVNLKEYPEIHFLMVGDGSEVQRLRAKVKRLHLNNVLILPAVSQEEYLDMLCQFDVGIISLNRSLKSHNIPGKILGYMNFAKPILASVNSGNELKDILLHYKAGLVSRSGDCRHFTQNALQLYKNKPTRDELAVNGRRVLDDLFSSTRAANQILTRLINGKQTAASELFSGADQIMTRHKADNLKVSYTARIEEGMAAETKAGHNGISGTS